MLIAPGFEQRSVITDRGTIAYAAPQPEFWPVATNSGETLVFLHGFGGGASSYEWSQVYPAFATDCRVIVPDLPGWGSSDHPQRDYRLEDYQIAITQLLQKLAPQGGIVIASSLTAALMVRVAVEKPELIKAMVLIAPSGLSDFGRDFRQSFLPRLLQVPVLDQLLYKTAIATTTGIQQFLAERQFANPDLITPEMVAAYLASASQPNAEYAALSFVRGDLCFDLAEWLPQLTTPTVILWGRQAQFTDVELGQRLADLNLDAIKQFQIVEDVGLTPQLERPEVTISLIRRALRQVSQSSANLRAV
ncbi:MAG: alpha/beta hydrolase [Cyanobacteria bacterium J06626_18]